MVEMEDFSKHCVTVMLKDDEEKLTTGEHTDHSIIKRSLVIHRFVSRSFIKHILVELYFHCSKEEENQLYFLVDDPSMSVHFEFSIVGEILSETGQVFHTL